MKTNNQLPRYNNQIITNNQLTNHQNTCRRRIWSLEFVRRGGLNLFVSCILVIGSLSVMGCSKKQDAKPQQESIPVKVIKVELKDIQKTLDYVGDIEAQDSVQVFPRVSGKIIEKLKEDGNPVSKNETIAYIDRDEVGLQFEKAPVDSPLTGIIGRVYVDKGASVTPQTAIALVVDIDKVKIDLDIPEKYLPKVSAGQEAKIEVDAYPEEIFKGIVSKVSPVVDLETRTAPIEIIISNQDHHLKPGMYARVHLVIEEHKKVPVLLKEAILGRGETLYVYTIENKKSFSRKITTGIRYGDFIEVTSGLKEGDVVVVMGQQRLKDGADVVTE